MSIRIIIDVPDRGNLSRLNVRDGCAQVKAFLGLDLDAARIQSVVTGSLHRQRCDVGLETGRQ